MAPYANLSYLMLRTAAAYVLAHLLRIAPRGDFDARLRRGRMAEHKKIAIKIAKKLM